MKQPEDIYLAVRDIAADRRIAYLDQACEGDAELRQRVERMLGKAEAANAFFDEHPDPDRETRTRLLDPEKFNPTSVETEGSVIGRYKLLQKIGEGGMGVVYMAEQSVPIHRMVALKIIKLGMDTRQVVARFEAEQQALARMDHPNIAGVLDAGATETGRPYFVMEMVRGMPITEFCNESKLTNEERLRLFMEVCHAVQHAHQKGIIHRDLKPSNIMVTLHGDKAVPKVIDFGIAKAIQGKLTDKTLFTQYQQFIGTPAYMSPEQASMSGLDIDTRSDIYSLGILLYELLTGRTPLDVKKLTSAGLEEIRRRIKEEEAPKPSTSLSTLVGSERTTLARLRRTDARALVSDLSGDLDWIVMKAIEKDRTRRYESADAFRADIIRHLNNEPVTARAPRENCSSATAI
jgi:serine/threonine protein kinase